jgi:hypothetical protein
MHLRVSSDSLRLSSCDIIYLFSIFKSQLVAGVILIKVWRSVGGVLVSRPLGGLHKASGSFIFFGSPYSSYLHNLRLA